MQQQHQPVETYQPRRTSHPAADVSTHVTDTAACSTADTVTFTPDTGPSFCSVEELFWSACHLSPLSPQTAAEI